MSRIKKAHWPPAVIEGRRDNEMKDEDGNPIVNEEEVTDDSSQEEAQEEELQEEEQHEEESEEQQEEESDEDSQEEAEEEDPKPSRREQLRINNLLRKYGHPDDQQRQAPRQAGINYRDMIDADDEVYDKLSQASQEYGNSQYEQGLREANKVRFETRLEVDAPKVESRYPQLDSRSEDFNPAVANSINQMYLSAVGYNEKTGHVDNPNLRYAEYVDAFMELVDEAASRKTETTRRTVTKQAARTGIRPSGTTSRTSLDLNKPAAAMSDKELDAAMAKMGLAPKNSR